MVLMSVVRLYAASFFLLSLLVFSSFLSLEFGHGGSAETWLSCLPATASRASSLQTLAYARTRHYLSVDQNKIDPPCFSVTESLAADPPNIPLQRCYLQALSWVEGLRTLVDEGGEYKLLENLRAFAPVLFAGDLRNFDLMTKDINSSCRQSTDGVLLPLQSPSMRQQEVAHLLRRKQQEFPDPATSSQVMSSSSRSGRDPVIFTTPDAYAPSRSSALARLLSDVVGVVPQAFSSDGWIKKNLSQAIAATPRFAGSEETNGAVYCPWRGGGHMEHGCATCVQGLGYNFIFSVVSFVLLDRNVTSSVKYCKRAVKLSKCASCTLSVVTYG